MKAVKEIIISDVVKKINESSFFIVVDYSRMTVPEFQEIRTRLKKVDAFFQVIKNSFVKKAINELKLDEDVNNLLSGQTAYITSASDICSVAKIVKNFNKEFDKPVFKGGVLDGKFVNVDQMNKLASLPSRGILQAQLLGLFNKPMELLVRVLNEPSSSFVRVLDNKSKLND